MNDAYFDSTAFKRSKHGNCFASFIENGTEKFGQIFYFVRIPGPPFYDETQANVSLFSIIEDIVLVKGYVFSAKESEHENLVPVTNESVPIQRLRKSKIFISDETMFLF